MADEKEIDYSKIKYTREWFKEHQAHTIFDIERFKRESCDNIIHIGDRFLLDLYGDKNDSEIWEVQLVKNKTYNKRRRTYFQFIPVRMIITGKQFGFPNGYWKQKKVKE
jgi:hypothetical protein